MDFRRAITAIAAHFPRKDVADRILVWSGAILSLMIFARGLVEYHIDNSIKRTNTTLEIHKVYLEKYEDKCIYLDNDFCNPDEYAKRLTAERCRYLIGEVKLGFSSCDALSAAHLTEMNAVSLNSVQRSKLRAALNAYRTEMIRPAYGKIDPLMAFFRSIIICVKKKTCDADTAISLFSADMTAFVNEICVYSQNNAKIFRYTTYLAQFLNANSVASDIYWGTDRGRENLFACDYLRELK